MNAEQRERCEKLVWLLENFETEKHNLVCPIETFDITSWSCGTSACAAGTAMLHPWFRERGFIDNGDKRDLAPIYVDGVTPYNWEYKFFGLNDEEDRLFYGFKYDVEDQGYITPQMVADRIKEVLAKYESSRGSVNE